MSTLKERQEAAELRVKNLDKLLSGHNQKQKTVAPAFDLAAYIDILMPYREYWSRSPYEYDFKTKSSSPEKQFLELVKYTFAKYRVPSNFAKVWINKIPNKETINPQWHNWRHRNRNQQQNVRRTVVKTIQDDLALWYITIAQGGSLYKDRANKYLTKKEVHCLLNCPHDLSIQQVMVFAVAKTFAENEGIALRLARSKLSETTFNEFLKTVIYFFAKNPPKSIEEIDDLLDFVKARQQEYAGITGHAPFTMNGFTLESLRRKCVDWHHELRRIKDMGSYEWVGAPFPDVIIEMKNGEGNFIKWHFTQIKNSKALSAEGTAMRHCVYGYRDSCVRNELYIWSLSSQAAFNSMITRKVTIELRNDGSIVQARGVANRVMKAEERHVVKTWADRNGFYLAC